MWTYLAKEDSIAINEYQKKKIAGRHKSVKLCPNSKPGVHR